MTDLYKSYLSLHVILQPRQLFDLPPSPCVAPLCEKHFITNALFEKQDSYLIFLLLSYGPSFHIMRDTLRCQRPLVGPLVTRCVCIHAFCT